MSWILVVVFNVATDRGGGQLGMKLGPFPTSKSCVAAGDQFRRMAGVAERRCILVPRGVQ